MAGLGRKVFTAGDVLTASDVQNYMMDQSVMYFAGTAARSSAIATPTTGMTSYIGVTGTATIPQLETYTGSAWQTPYGMTQVANVTYSGASTISVNNVFTSAFDYYKIILTNDALATSSGNVYIKFRVAGNDSSASYNWGALGVEAGGNQLGNHGNNSSLGFLISQTRNANGTFGFSMEVQNVAIATPTQVQFIFTSNTPTYNTVEGTFGGGQHSVNTAYDGFSIIAPGNIQGKIKVYGYRNS
jgi:hypothetical protein